MYKREIEDAVDEGRARRLAALERVGAWWGGGVVRPFATDTRPTATAVCAGNEAGARTAAERARLAVEGLTAFLDPARDYAPFGHVFFNRRTPWMTNQTGAEGAWKEKTRLRSASLGNPRFPSRRITPTGSGACPPRSPGNGPVRCARRDPIPWIRQKNAINSAVVRPVYQPPERKGLQQPEHAGI